MLLLCITGCAKNESKGKSIRLGTGGEGGTYFAYGTQLKNIAKKNANLSMEIQTSTGSASNIRLIENNLVDMAIVQNDVLSDAFKGKNEFEGNTLKKTKAVAGLYTEVYQIVVNKNLHLSSVEDLSGLRVSVGEDGSGVLKNAKNILKVYGMSLNDIDAKYLSFDEAAQAMKDGKLDAFFVTAATPTKAIADLSEQIPLDILPLDDRALRMLSDSYSGYTPKTIKKGTYTGVDKDISTIGVMAVLVANENVPANQINDILNLLNEHQDSFSSLAGNTINTFDSSTLDHIELPFHSAAIKWYNAKGISITKPQTATTGTSRKVFNLDMYQTVALAVLALFVGVLLKEKFTFLTTFCIPAAVVGGIIFAIISCILYATGIAELNFDETLRNVCMVMFFTSVGFQANMKVLKSGGKGTFIFLIAVFALIIIQNSTAVGLSKILHLHPLIGLCTGSIPMIGGHGTAGAFGPLLEDMNVSGATTLATAAATFGLVAGSLMGGPLANNLIKKKDLTKTAVYEDDSMLIEEEVKQKREVSMYAPTVYQLCLAMDIGTIISFLLSKTGMTFPIYNEIAITSAFPM